MLAPVWISPVDQHLLKGSAQLATDTRQVQVADPNELQALPVPASVGSIVDGRDRGTEQRSGGYDSLTSTMATVSLTAEATASSPCFSQRHFENIDCVGN